MQNLCKIVFFIVYIKIYFNWKKEGYVKFLLQKVTFIYNIIENIVEL